MLIVGWFALLLGGLGLTVFASIRSVGRIQTVVQRSRIPPFFVGLTLMSVGTDLPEIANSLISSFAGHGDLNAGDSIGSAVTQATLVLGLLPFLARPFRVPRFRLFVICLASMMALALGAVLMRDGFISRADGLILVLAWPIGSMLVMRQLSTAAEEPPAPGGPVLTDVGLALVFMALVGVGAAAMIKAFVEISSTLGAPEYLLSFFVASVGTSLPELAIDVVALRRGFRELALGDVLGSSFVDSTLSIGIGPLFFPTSVTATLAVTGSLTAIAALGLVALTMALARQHDRKTGVVLILLYVGVYFVMLS
ncbi:MAG: hypothetical protein OEU54_12540 [Gemmatimonadota bacterium]|nr:hypothetical protein [Gemmatimonadota bacterium]